MCCLVELGVKNDPFILGSVTLARGREHVPHVLPLEFFAHIFFQRTVLDECDSSLHICANVESQLTKVVRSHKDYWSFCYFFLLPSPFADVLLDDDWTGWMGAGWCRSAFSRLVQICVWSAANAWSKRRAREKMWFGQEATAGSLKGCLHRSHH